MSEDQFNLPEELAALALKDVGETKERRSAALLELRERIEALPESDRLSDTSDANIIRFIRSRKYDIAKALESSIKYKHFLDKNPDVVNQPPGLKKLVLLSKDFLEVIRDGVAGKVYVCMRPKKGVSLFTPELKREYPRAMMIINFWMFDTLSKMPQCQIAGMVILNSFANLTLMDNIALQNMAPMSGQVATFQLFSILGTRLKGAFIFEQPFLMTAIWFLARPFMSAKVQSRFHLCGSNYEIMLKIVDKGILPEDFGGTRTGPIGTNFCVEAAKHLQDS